MLVVLRDFRGMKTSLGSVDKRVQLPVRDGNESRALIVSPELIEKYFSSAL
jgi:hypothetical protein